MYLIKVLKAVIGSLNSRNDKQYKIQWPKDKRRNNDTFSNFKSRIASLKIIELNAI
jgi:hypothetical protein